MTAPQKPRVEIVRGDPTPEEVAALVAVLLAARAHESVSGGGVPGPSAEPVRKKWANPAHGMRRGLAHGPGAWRSPMLRH
ncbi:acyl-CoA carboxylase epsilon subunit [Microtetraspora glauca]|uniref:Acyl-CoA carboxylase epsilon subunit n=1 Tax=Microtetraspora glauca TaxID=1996 RepID=A0ABV3G6T9_MICGL